MDLAPLNRTLDGGDARAALAEAQRFIQEAAGAAKAAPAVASDEAWQPMLDKVAALQAIAHKRLAPGSTDPGVVRQRNRPPARRTPSAS